ncbi:Dimethyladenosine transferase 2, mitochondrial [Gamsiella multidivaricata]|nr:Dimethyladenosine transferase 2, mitochondrial [Gamsiella multidivaricata]
MSIVRPVLQSLPKLPAAGLWPTLFKVSRARGQMRVSVMTEELAGPGQLTRSMALAGAKKVVTVENGEAYQKSLKSLIDESGGRIQNFALNPSSDPFEEIMDPTKAVFPDLEPQPWDKVHTDLVIVGSIPNSSLGEKVVQDLLIASIGRMGIFRMGRVEMYMFCFKDAVKRLKAEPGEPARNRVTILAEAAAEIMPISRPGSHHFHLPFDYELLHIVPHEKPKMETSTEIMDFCLRSLFTNKSHALNKVIKLLGPGADILLGRLSFDHNIKIKHMTLEQLNEVALKFEQWPLRPTVLYDDMIMTETKRKR